MIQQNKAVTIRSQGETYTGADTSLLLYKLTRVWIPVAELPDLLLGQRTQLGPEWRVGYEGAIEQSPYRLPEKLTLANTDFALQIFISQWSL